MTININAVVGYAAIALAAVFGLLPLLGLAFPRLGHRWFGWHVCDKTGHDGCSAHGVCRICGKECLQDSQGNWF